MVKVFITGQTAYKDYKVESWSDTEILVACDKLPMVRNVILKVTITVGGVSKSKSVKCIGSNYAISQFASQSGNREYVAYPRAWWEVCNQYALNGWDIQNLAGGGNIDSTYIPHIGDIFGT